MKSRQGPGERSFFPSTPPNGSMLRKPYKRPWIELPQQALQPKHLVPILTVSSGWVRDHPIRLGAAFGFVDGSKDGMAIVRH